jgi:hypothetical protein
MLNIFVVAMVVLIAIKHRIMSFDHVVIANFNRFCFSF